MPTVRRIEKQDLVDCARIYADAFSERPYFGGWDVPTALEMLTGLWKRDPESCLCIEDGEIVGFAFCTTYGTFRVTVQEFAVSPARQKQGLGTLLMEHLLNLFRSRGIQNIDLVANTDAPAFAFYRKFGFRVPEKYVVMARRL